MADQEQPRRPRLEVALEQLTQTTQQLTSTSLAYQHAKGIATQLDSNPDASMEDAGLTLQIGDLQIPVPLPTDPAQRVGIINDAVSSLGQEVVRLWNQAFEIAQGAKQHCEQAAAAAAQQQ